ncbi:MAG: hypothetical protein ACLP52_25125 [Streptosporangiaceae bacterium]
MTARSDDQRELVEGCADPVAGGYLGGEFIVPAAEILDERMPGGDDPRRAAAFHPDFPVRWLSNRIAYTSVRAANSAPKNATFACCGDL